MTEPARIIGNRTPWETFACDLWRTERVRAASGLAQHPYVAGDGPQLVPPSFLSAQYVDAFALGVPDAPARLNGGNRCRWLADVHIGEVLEKQSAVVDASAKEGASGRLEIYTIETSYRRPDDSTPVAELEYTAIRRYPVERSADDPAPPEPGGGGTGPAKSRGVPASAELLLTARTTPRDVISYAVATDDMYEAHYDLEHARRAGLPGTITHGLLKLAWLARAAVERAGESYVVREIGAKYRGLDLTTDRFEIWGDAQHPAEEEVRYDLYGVSVDGAVSTVGDVVLAPHDY